MFPLNGKIAKDKKLIYNYENKTNIYGTIENKLKKG